MWIVVSGIDRFHIIDLMTEQHSYNIHYFFSNIAKLLRWALFPHDRKELSCRLGVHLFNCRVHRLKAPDAFSAEKNFVRVEQTKQADGAEDLGRHGWEDDRLDSSVPCPTRK
jgi:hypothetical protein